ncbi:unnamed protein product [Paramecium sonneborni]|uniref:Uncharacterized protein n=1 Tax=Paramecium sonneborni TaxID=65129 RepID=A0A8S1R192_9CILI|nr:unnamed protein product [Paramecium sonneborni]
MKQNLNKTSIKRVRFINSSQEKQTFKCSFRIIFLNNLIQNEGVIIKKFTYNLIQNNSIKQTQGCGAIAFNNDNSIILAGCNKQIKVFEFKQEQLKQTQLLSEHSSSVDTLNFINQSSQFIRKFRQLYHNTVNE